MYPDRLARRLFTIGVAACASIAVAAPAVIPVTSTPAPSASQPAASQPAASAPESSTPESSTPESSAPESSTPESSTPESSTPESSAPASAAPASSAPESAAPASAAPAASAPDRESAPAGSLDLQALEEQLRETNAIGLFTKLALKNQVDDLLAQFRDHYDGKATVTMAQLRRSYDLLLMKVLSLIQDTDRKLARSIIESREALWDLLADPARFSTLRG